MSSESGARNVVLVHGGFVDGSGWQAVHDLLTKDGYRVAVVQNPTLSLEDDAAVTRRGIDDLGGRQTPALRVGEQVIFGFDPEGYESALAAGEK